MRSFLTALMLMSLAALAAGFLGRLHPALDSLAHFRVHFILATLALAALALLARARGAALAGLIAALLAGSTVALYALPFGSADDDSQQDGTITLLQMNLLYKADLADAILTIEAADPDIVTLQEVTPAHWAALDALDYAHRVRCETSLLVGTVAILSRLPFSGAVDVCIPEENFLAQAVPFGGATLNVVSQHLSWPWPYGQAQQIEMVTPTLRGLRAPTVIAGDFNAAPWSKAVRSYARAAGASPVRGIGTTWPTFTPGRGADVPAWLMRIAGLPLDNVLVTPNVAAKAAILPATGSDHAPVLVSLTPAD